MSDLRANLIQGAADARRVLGEAGLTGPMDQLAATFRDALTAHGIAITDDVVFASIITAVLINNGTDGNLVFAALAGLAE